MPEEPDCSGGTLAYASVPCQVFSMTTVRIRDLLGRRILVTRTSARSIKPILAAAIERAEYQLDLDFTAIAGAAPSFLDETMAVIDEITPVSDEQQTKVRLLNLPPRLWTNVVKAGKRHGLMLERQSGTVVTISKTREDRD